MTSHRTLLIAFLLVCVLFGLLGPSAVGLSVGGERETRSDPSQKVSSIDQGKTDPDVQVRRSKDDEQHHLEPRQLVVTRFRTRTRWRTRWRTRIRVVRRTKTETLTRLATATTRTTTRATGNVIFFHPDGMGANSWGAVRYATVGPDNRTNWDQLPASAVYLGHLKDSIASSSHGGATVHAYGKRVLRDSFGMDGTTPIKQLGGGDGGIAAEAMRQGRWVGLVNSGAAYEPGTAAHVASVTSRSDLFEITRQVVASGVQVHFAGGERYYLPNEVPGRFGVGRRTDGRDLVEELIAA
jgi:alkaline phosphatase